MRAEFRTGIGGPGHYSMGEHVEVQAASVPILTPKMML